jgi:hypothetical protein
VLFFLQLSGGIHFPEPSAGLVKTLSLGDNLALQCPIQLGAHTALHHLDLQKAGIQNCDFMNSTQVQLPGGLVYLDISNNAWLPMVLFLNLPQLHVLKAKNASIHAMMAGDVTPPLETILLDQNPFWVDTAQWKWSWLTGVQQVVPTLKIFSCASCNLQLKLDTLASQFASGNILQQLSLSDNLFEGDVPSTWWNEWIQAQGPDMQQQSWPLSLQTLDLSMNPGITGTEHEEPALK